MDERMEGAGSFGFVLFFSEKFFLTVVDALNRLAYVSKKVLSSLLQAVSAQPGFLSRWREKKGGKHGWPAD